MTAGPCDRPQSDGLSAIWCFEKGGKVGVASLGNARVSGMFEGLDAFGHFGSGDF